jgi:uncharacterized membrane protein YdjX (TVP38/TMEM64 family)
LQQPSRLWRSIAGGVAVLLGVAAIYWLLSEAGLTAALWDRNLLRHRIDQLGAWGPVALIALEALAIIVTPIPSGPIAVVGGAVFGPLWGTLYVVAGAVAGALIAFLIARCFGYEAVRRWSGSQKLMAMLSQHRSQWWLMAVVFATRLVPFISFDAVSYAAGLTPLAFWRFAVATIVGVVPISFLLTYAGEELMSAEPMTLTITLILLGGITIVPIALKLAWDAWRRRAQSS